MMNEKQYSGNILRTCVSYSEHVVVGGFWTAGALDEHLGAHQAYVDAKIISSCRHPLRRA